MGSPVCRAFMDEHGMTSAHELSEYYITKMADYLQQYHVQFSGWQEAALGHSEATDRHLNRLAAGVYCWNTVPEWEADEIPYQVANMMLTPMKEGSRGPDMWMNLKAFPCFHITSIALRVLIWLAIRSI